MINRRFQPAEKVNLDNFLQVEICGGLHFSHWGITSKICRCRKNDMF